MASPAYLELAKQAINRHQHKEAQSEMFDDQKKDIEKGVQDRIVGDKTGITEPEEEHG
jgi:hypothetical protein